MTFIIEPIDSQPMEYSYFITIAFINLHGKKHRSGNAWIYNATDVCIWIIDGFRHSVFYNNNYVPFLHVKM